MYNEIKTPETSKKFSENNKEFFCQGFNYVLCSVSASLLWLNIFSFRLMISLLMLLELQWKQHNVLHVTCVLICVLLRH